MSTMLQMLQASLVCRTVICYLPCGKTRVPSFPERGSSPTVREGVSKDDETDVLSLTVGLLPQIRSSGSGGMENPGFGLKDTAVNVSEIGVDHTSIGEE